MTQQSEPVTQTSGGDPTIGKLIADVSRDMSALISKEIELAKSELKVSATRGGIGIALFALAGFILLLSVIFLSIAIAYLIHWNGDGLALQWAFLIVCGFYVVLAAGLVWVGIGQVKKVRAPEAAIRQAQEIPKAFKPGS